MLRKSIHITEPIKMTLVYNNVYYIEMLREYFNLSKINANVLKIK